MNDKLFNYPNNEKQMKITSAVDFIIGLMKIPKVFTPTNEKAWFKKTLGTSIILHPNVPFAPPVDYCHPNLYF